MNESSNWKPDGTKDSTFKNAPNQGPQSRLHNPFKLSNSKIKNQEQVGTKMIQ